MAWLEFAWLGLLLVVPLYFNVYAAAPFEAAKAELAMLGGAALLLIWAVEAVRRRPQRTRRLPQAVLLPAGILLLAIALATLISVEPARSLFGAPFRRQGALFLGFCVAVGFAVATQVDSQAKAERLIWALIVPSVPVMAYALLQSRGWDFYVWRLEAGAASYRVFGTLGHPSFLAAYMVMVIPLTIVEAWRFLPSARPPRAYGWRAALLLALAGGQVTVLLWAERRAAFLGLLAALLALTLLAYRLRLLRKRLAVVYVAALVVVLALVTGFLRPLAGRLADLSQDDAYQTGHQRLLVWEATGHALIAHPGRLFAGFGPATLDQVLPPYRPLALHDLVGDAPFDHAHSAPWEVLASTGVIGLFAYLALLLGLFAHGLAALGLLEEGQLTARPVAFAVGGAFAGALVAALVLGAWGVVLPAGVLGGAAGLFAAALLPPSAAGRPLPDVHARLRMAGLLASLLGYVVVSQFNVPDVTTTLFFWVCAALLIATAGGLPNVSPAPAELDLRRATIALAMLVPATLLFDVSGWVGLQSVAWVTLALPVVAGAAVYLFVERVSYGKLPPSSHS